MLTQSLREKATDICVDCTKGVLETEFKTDQGGNGSCDNQIAS